MKSDLPSFVVRLKGTLYFKRRGWPTRKFQAQELGNEFYAEYATILNGTAPQPKAFLVKGLIGAYYKSPKFARLKPRTKEDYTKFLSRFEINAGDLVVSSIRRKHVIAWRDQLVQSESAHYANYFVRVLRVLFRYAGDIDEISVAENPAKNVEEVRYEKKKTPPWPREMIKAARDELPHNHRTRLLFELLYCSGQRIGDVLVMKWSDIRGEGLCVSQNKTGADLVIPITEELRECLRRAERESEYILAKDMTKTKENGPWAYRSAAQAMMKLRKAIGAEDYNIHAIRHTVASEIGAAGSDDEIAAITGHTTKAMVAHYAGGERQKARARSAQKKRK